MLAGAAGAALVVATANIDAATGPALVLITLIAFLAGRCTSRPAGFAVISLLIGGVVAALLIGPEADSVAPALMGPLTLFLAGFRAALRTRPDRGRAA